MKRQYREAREAKHYDAIAEVVEEQSEFASGFDPDWQLNTTEPKIAWICGGATTSLAYRWQKGTFDGYVCYV